MHLRKLFSPYLGAMLLAFLCVSALIGCQTTPLVTGNNSLSSDSINHNTSHPSNSTRSKPTQAPTGSPIGPADGWQSFLMLGAAGSTASVLLNANLRNQMDSLTQYALPVLQPSDIDGIAPNGQDVLFQYDTDGQTRFSVTMQQQPQATYFYTEQDSDGVGNAIWMPDSRHVLVLKPNSGIWQVDVQTGQAQQFLSFPIQVSPMQSITTMTRLLAYRPGMIYFVGNDDVCPSQICGLELGQATIVRQYTTGQQLDLSSFLLSPDGHTIYYCNTDPQITNSGLVAVNVQNGARRVLRRSMGIHGACGSGLPVGFAADNGLVEVAHINGQFPVIELGNTPQQDRVLLTNIAPGAASLCLADEPDPYAPDVCLHNVALSPYSHSIVVEGALPNGQPQLWGIELSGGTLFTRTLKDIGPVALLGWDKIPVCPGTRC